VLAVLPFPLRQPQLRSFVVARFAGTITKSYDYPPDARVVADPDNWRWKSDEQFSWKEHEGCGYWHDGDCRPFRLV
jgi:hypothetical protein